MRSANGTRGRRSDRKLKSTHARCKHAIVLDVPDQHRRSAVLDLGQPDAETRRAADHQFVDIGRGIVRAAHRHVVQAPPDLQEPLRHDSIMVAITAPMRSGNQPPSTIFSEFETRNIASIAPNRAMTRPATTGGHFHRVDRDAIEQDRGDHHRPRHGDAVGGSQAVRGAEHDHDEQRSDHQQPVCGGNVNLAGLSLEVGMILERGHSPI